MGVSPQPRRLVSSLKAVPTASGTAAFSKLAGGNTPLITKLAIGRVSEDLVGSPELRAQFVQNPTDFLQKHYGLKPNADEATYFSDLASKFADGFCCGGCACSSVAPGEAELVSRISR
jgi:hypothetical protein